MAGSKDDDPEDADQADDDIADENNACSGTQVSQVHVPGDGMGPETISYLQHESKVQHLAKTTKTQRLQHEEKDSKYLVKSAVNTGRQYDFRSNLHAQNSASNSNSTSKVRQRELQAVNQN